MIKIFCTCALYLAALNLVGQNLKSRIVGYIPSWANMTDIINQTDFNGFSHVMLAFANPDIDGNMTIGSLSSNTIQNLVNKAHQSGCLVMISIGGGSTDINAAWLHFLKKENHQLLNQNLMDIVNQYRFDGIDVDLEGDLVLSANYAGFVADLDEALPSHKLLTAAMATWSASNLSATTLSHYDFINVMSYDQTGPWTPNSPGPHSSYEQAVSDVKYWTTTKGLPADKVVLGVPFYGYNFVSGTNIYSMVYKDIVNENVGAEALDVINTIYYNGQPTIVAKAEYAAKNAGGIMIWEITQDVTYTDDRSLLKSIHSVIEPIHSEILSLEIPEESYHCYPNPVQDYVTLSNADELSPITILNLEGKEIWKGHLNAQKADVSGLTPGIYVVVYNVNKNRLKSKFIKE